MKVTIIPKSNHHSTAIGQRPAGIRPSVAKTFEHRYERRKIREQLRRLDWALNIEE